MSLPNQIAKHFREVYTGDNWTAVNMKDVLAGITYQQAITKVHNLNTIAMLVYHINYYVSAVLKVLHGEPLKASDKYAFALTPITSEEEWQQLIAKAFSEAETFATIIEKFDEKKFFELFDDPKYGNYFRNIVGIVEHTYYHLGQISLIKKILNEPNR
jgi:hypothetical protein